MDYDLIVIGAGPAGSSFCRYISPNYSVLLVEKRALDENGVFSSSKACGGLLNLECQRELALQSIAIPKKLMQDPQMFTVRAIDLDNGISRHYQKSYLNIDRRLLDSFLLSKISPHVEVMSEAAYHSHTDQGALIEVEVRTKEGMRSFTCRQLIDAGGASAPVSRRMHERPRYYTCIQRHYQTEKKLPYMFAVFDKHVTDYYSWGIQKQDRLIVGAAMSQEGSAVCKFDYLIDRLKRMGFDLSREIEREGAPLLRPKKTSEIYLGKRNISVIGEAATLISPSSSEGISFALRSGRFLAESMNHDFRKFRRAYYKACEKLKWSIFIKEKKSGLMYGLKSRNLIIRSGVLSTKIKGTKNFPL